MSHKLIDNGTCIQTNIRDFEASLEKVSSIQSQFFLHKLWLLIAKTYRHFLRIDEFLSY